MTFTVPIRIDPQGVDTALRKVNTDLDRLERTGKAAGEAVSKALALGTIPADQAAAATKRYAAELVRAEVAAEKLAAASANRGMFDGINRSVRSLTQFTGELGLAGNAIGGFVGGAMSIVESLASWHVSMLQINDQLIETRNRLRNVTETETALGFALANTRGIADRTLTSWDTTVDVYARMSSATKELGLSQQHVGRLTETLGKAFAASGRSAGETSAAMLQLSQAIGSGVLQGDEFRSLAENMPQLLTVFSRELGVTRGELKKLASEGKITTDVMIAGLDKMADSADRAFDRMEKTFAQKVRPLLTEMQADPLKLNRAVSGSSLGDANDIFKGAQAGGFFDGELSSFLTGGYNEIKAATGAAADYGRQVLDLGAKLRDLGGELESMGKRDPWATAKPALLGFDMQLQQLIEKIDYINSPKMVMDGARAWSALGASIAGFADSAASDLDGVLSRVLALSGGGDTSPIKAAIDRFAEQAKKNASWDPAGRTKTKAGGAAPWQPDTNYWGAVGMDLKNLGQASGLVDFWGDGGIDFAAMASAMEEPKGMFDSLVESATELAEQMKVAAGFDPWDGDKLERMRQANDLTAAWNQKIKAQQTDWKAIEQLGTSALGSLEDSFVRLFQTGEFGFKQMIDSMMAQLTRLATHQFFQSILGAAGGLSMWGNPSATGSGARQGFSGFFGSAPGFTPIPGVDRMARMPSAPMAPTIVVQNTNSVRIIDDKHALLEAMDSREGQRIMARRSRQGRSPS